MHYHPFIAARITSVRSRRFLNPVGDGAMRLNRKNAVSADREPMGIVIADGGEPETTTRFLAFVWGPVPDDVESPSDAPVLAVATV